MAYQGRNIGTGVGSLDGKCDVRQWDQQECGDVIQELLSPTPALFMEIFWLRMPHASFYDHLPYWTPTPSF